MDQIRVTIVDDKDIMENLIPIIEFQDEIQRTPQELINYLQSKVDRIDRLVVFGIIEDEKGTRIQEYAIASKDRKYKRSSVVWDALQWLKYFTE